MRSPRSAPISVAAGTWIALSPSPYFKNYFTTTRRNGFWDFDYVRLGCVVED